MPMSLCCARVSCRGRWPAPAPPDTVRLRAPARRRLLTCLVAVPHDVNMPGSQSDPEAVHATLLDLRSRIAGICDAYHGIVRDSEAAAFTIVFGWPHSRESDVLNAVVAARQLVGGQIGRPAGRSPHQPLPLGVGVATGEVVTTPGTGAPFLLGDLAEQAGALARAASRGQVLVASSTWQLVSHAAHGSRAPAGTALPGDHSAAIVLGDVDADAASIQRRWEGPYIGRQAELGLLDDAFNAARIRSAGQFVTLLGEPGVGKTRLSLEFERVVRPDAIVLRGRCRLYDEGVPYRPFQEIIEQAADGAAPDEWLMSIGVGQEVRDVILAVLGRGQERTGGQTHWAIGRVMAAITQRFPAVVIVDDVQHASPEVLDLLEALAEPLRGMPVLMICLAETGTTAGPPGLGKRLALGQDDDVAAAGRSREPPAACPAHPRGCRRRGPRATGRRQERTGRHCSWESVVSRTARPASPGKPRRPDIIPPALHGLLASRLDLLPEDERTTPRARGRRGGSLPPGVGRGRSWPGKISRDQRAQPGPGAGCFDQAGSRRPGRPAAASAAARRSASGTG